MKINIKYFFIYTVIFALFGACNTSEEGNNDQKKVISKITSKYLDYVGGEKVEVIEANTFVYDKNQVVKIEVSKDFCSNYTYDGSKILSSYGCNNGDKRNVFTYSGNKLVKESSDEVINEFFYDLEKLKEIKTSYVTDNFTKKYSSKYYFSGNNVSSTIEDEFWTSEPTITEYKYDDKKNPFTNHSLYFKLIWGSEFLGENNAIEKTIGNTVIKYTIIYDSENYPIKVTGINQETGELWTEYTYEYIKI
jgi:hypothetical protein